MKRKILPCLGAALVVVLGAGVALFRTERATADYDYTETEEGICISQVNVTGSELVLPTEIDGKTVVGLGENAFGGSPEIVSLTIPQSVERVAFGALSGLKYLETLTVPFVGASAEATGAEKTLGYMFGSAAGSGSYTLQRYSKTESAAYYLPYRLKTLQVSGGVLGYGSFYGCTSLETVTIASAITEIPSYAFRGATALKTVTLPDSVQTVGEKAFYNAGVQSINLEKVEGIGEYAFANTALGAVALDGARSIGYGAFSGAEKLSSVSLGQALESVGGYAFAYCARLQSITLPESVVSVGAGAFYQTTRLASVEYTGERFLSENGVLYNADKTELIVYPAMKTDKSFTLPSSVRKIYENAFNGNKFLQTLAVNPETEEIGACAFSACPSLTSLTVYFTGKSASATGKEALLGYVFGETPFEGCKVEKATADGVEYGYYCLPMNCVVTVA